MALKRLAWLTPALIALAVAGGIWLVWFAGPGISVEAKGSEVWVDTRWLGEYFTAASEIQVSSGSGEVVFRATSPSHGCVSTLYRFVAGANEVPFAASEACAIDVPYESSAFTLQAGKTYTFSVVGSTFFGNYRRASRRFVVPGAVDMSPTNASQQIRAKVTPRERQAS